MRVLGVAVEMMGPNRPRVRAVIVDDTSGSPRIAAFLDIPVADDDLAQRLFDTHRTVVTRVQGLGVLDRAVVRRADVAQPGNRSDSPRQRLLTEGATIAALKAVVSDTVVGTGAELSRRAGSDKKTWLSTGLALASTHGRPAAYGDAAAAGLSGLID